VQTTLTILTPTYNRANLLPRLYKSLQNQTNKNFTWLVCDDGSCDNTKEIISEFAKDATFEIQYISKPNGGKHTAINLAVKNIISKLTLFLDSDDYLTENAVQLICEYNNKYKKTPNICGFCFLKADEKLSTTGLAFEKDEEISNYVQTRLKQNIYGDKAEVIYTDVLKEFPFPEIEGEKFISEDVIWIPMGLKYNMVFINKPIYICEYQDSGLSSMAKILPIKSPKGAMQRANVFMLRGIPLKFKIKGALLFSVYSRFARAGFAKSFKTAKNGILFLLAYLPSLLLYYKYKKSTHPGGTND
jgi:glycosyltransferase involved in cell wall biosynthesis